MPREEDIISLVIDEDLIYLLSSSPAIESIESPNKFSLYCGSMNNMN